MSTFEFTIRILGGLLSGYYLSQDNRFFLSYNQAKVNLKSRTGTSVNDRVSLAEFGTLTVEFR